MIWLGTILKLAEAIIPNFCFNSGNIATAYCDFYLFFPIVRVLLGLCPFYQADLPRKGGHAVFRPQGFFFFRGFCLVWIHSNPLHANIILSLLLSNYNISASTKPNSLIFKSCINSHHPVLCSRFFFPMAPLDLGECYIKCVHWRVSNQVISSIYKNWILKVILIISLNPGTR